MIRDAASTQAIGGYRSRPVRDRENDGSCAKRSCGCALSGQRRRRGEFRRARMIRASHHHPDYASAPTDPRSASVVGLLVGSDLGPGLSFRGVSLLMVFLLLMIFLRAAPFFFATNRITDPLVSRSLVVPPDVVRHTIEFREQGVMPYSHQTQFVGNNR